MLTLFHWCEVWREMMVRILAIDGRTEEFQNSVGKLFKSNYIHLRDTIEVFWCYF